jgi:hypothetical protein
MRISAQDDTAADAVVYWNGKPCYWFVTVDTDEGWGDKLVVDAAGKVVVERDPDTRESRPKIERVYGDLRVEFPRRDEQPETAPA